MHRSWRRGGGGVISMHAPSPDVGPAPKVFHLIELSRGRTSVCLTPTAPPKVSRVPWRVREDMAREGAPVAAGLQQEEQVRLALRPRGCERAGSGPPVLEFLGGCSRAAVLGE